MQAKALQSKLQEKENRDTVVVLADEKLLIPVLNAIPDAEAYQNLNVSMGYPIKSTPVSQLITFYFTMQRRGTIVREINDRGTLHQTKGRYIWHLIRLMDLEIVKIVFPKQEIDIFNRWKNKVMKEGKFIFEASDYEELASAPKLQEFLKAILVEQNENTPLAVLYNLGQVLSLLAKTINTKEDKDHQLHPSW